MHCGVESGQAGAAWKITTGWRSFAGAALRRSCDYIWGIFLQVRGGVGRHVVERERFVVHGLQGGPFTGAWASR